METLPKIQENTPKWKELGITEEEYNKQLKDAIRDSEERILRWSRQGKKRKTLNGSSLEFGQNRLMSLLSLS